MNEYLFTTEVAENALENEFKVEFFHPEGNPYKVTNNFDELIDFLELHFEE